MTAENALAIVMAGELSETLAYFPKYRDILLSLQAKWLSLVAQVETDWEHYKSLAGNRAEFAKAINHLSHKTVLFSIADGKNWRNLCSSNPKRTLKFLED